MTNQTKELKIMAVVREAVATIMRHLMNHSDHGYYLGGRNTGFETVSIYGRDVTIATGDYDCSTAVLAAYRAAGVDCGSASYTGNMISGLPSQCFTVHPAGDGYTLKMGDLALCVNSSSANHVAMCVAYTGESLGDFWPANGSKDANPGNQGGETRWIQKNAYPWTHYIELNSCIGDMFWSDGTVAEAGGSGQGGRPVGSGSTTPSGQIVEDGNWGPATTSAMQRHYGLVVDGEVWHQWASNIAANPNLLTSSWKSDTTQLGSPMVRAMQADLGVTADGIMGPQTIRAIYALFGGVYGSSNTISGPAVWQIQHQLNTGIWPYHL